VRLSPEITDIEGADTTFAVAGRTSCRKCLCSEGLPGRLAHIESPGTVMEQERPRSNRHLVTAGAAKRGITGAGLCKWLLGVGLSHSRRRASARETWPRRCFRIARHWSRARHVRGVSRS
jgi:hypothetical protein